MGGTTLPWKKLLSAREKNAILINEKLIFLKIKVIL